MDYRIAVVPGDGIGPEVVGQTLKVLDKVGEIYGHSFEYEKVLAGGCAIDAVGQCLPQETIATCKAADAVLLGAVGGWKWDTLPGNERPEMALLGLRKELGLFANLRPAMLFEELAEACPLRPEIIEGGLDIVVVRELTGGIYFGEKGTKDTDMGPAAYDVDALILYDDSEDPLQVLQAVKLLNDAGKTVRAERARSGSIQYRQLLQLRKGGLEILETND